MKKWIIRSALWMSVVFLCVAGTFPATPDTAPAPEKDFYYSLAAKEAVDPNRQNAPSLVVVPWMMFSVESEDHTGSILTLEMSDANGNRVDLHIREQNGLTVLYFSDLESGGMNRTSEDSENSGTGLISAVQMNFHEDTVYTAVAVGKGLYICWNDGSVFLPYNSVFQSDADMGCTCIEGEYVHLTCQNISVSRQSAKGDTDGSRPVMIQASPDTGDCLHADANGFQNRREELPAADKARDTAGKKNGVWIAFKIFIAAVILFLLIFLYENVGYFRRRLMKRRIIKPFQPKNRSKIKKKKRFKQENPASCGLKCVEEQKSEDLDEVSFGTAFEDADGGDIRIPVLADADVPERKSGQAAKSEEKRNETESDKIQTNGEDKDPYFEIYNSRTVFVNLRKEMKGYNLNNDQIIEYMKSNHTEPWNVQLLEADIRRSCFVLAEGKYLWIHPVWMNCWNGGPLYLNPLWFETHSIEYAFYVRKGGSGKSVLLSALQHAAVADAEPALIEKIKDQVFIKRKGVIYIR